MRSLLTFGTSGDGSSHAAYIGFAEPRVARDHGRPIGMLVLLS